MSPEDFIRTWAGNPLSERASAQAHFIALCGLLEIEPPSPKTAGTFEFEKGASKTTGGDGWADVWLKDAFAWEYKKSKANLDRAYEQVQRYAPALDNPPLLIVSDTQSITIRTAFTGAVQERHDIAIDDLRDGAMRDLLRRAFTEPDSFKPKKTRADLTEDAAATFAHLALRLRQKGHKAHVVAHFVNRLVFCMFAEDVQLLPEKLFEKMVFASTAESFTDNCRTLFAAMANKNGVVGFTKIPWFNGGLFDDDSVIAIDSEDIEMLRKAATMDWSQIDASLLGTLFERGLDPDKRSQLGAHYTDAGKIMQIIEPVILRPLRAEWEATKAEIELTLTALPKTTKNARLSSAQKGQVTKGLAKVRELHLAFLERLKNVRVLDPACGSGNFLNLALTSLKDLEHRANLDAEALGLLRPAPQVGPECVLGIELSPYAAELARVSTWIAEIQWMRRNGFDATRNPILKPLDTIECRDAVLGDDGKPAQWPEAEFIVGNPPFLGNSRMISELGENYTMSLRKAWAGVPGGVDLVAYWVAGAWQAIKAGRASRAGLVTTNSIRGGANRETLKPIVEEGRIFEAWSDEPWTVAGASVRVSMVMFDSACDQNARLNGVEVKKIASDLISAAFDLTTAQTQKENTQVCFEGYRKYGKLDISGETARIWLRLPANANGKKNCEVLYPYIGGKEITQKNDDVWVIDFFEFRELDSASFFEAPFEYAKRYVKPYRATVRDAQRREKWWLFGRSGIALREATKRCQRILVTPRVSKHRVFVWRSTETRPSDATNAIARDDDTTFGILHSRFHEAWSLRMGTWLGKGNDPRYTPSTTFETFPFPQGLTPNIPAADYADDSRAIAIAEAAKELNDKREAWLNPPDLVKRVPEVVEGYPDRILPIDDEAEKILKKRTLTNLYNARPAWLDGLHKRLDAAVARAYGWPEDISEDEALAKLLELNLARASR